MAQEDDGGVALASQASPATSLHCYELECAVKISSICANKAKAAGSVATKHAVVTVGRNAKRQIVLQVCLSEVKGLQHVSYLLQHCKVHGRMVKQGCGSIEIPHKQVVIFLSNCPPRKLNIFLKTLDAKLALWIDGKSQNIGTPLSAVRRQMLEGLPDVFEKLSPLAVAEIRQLRKIRGQPVASPLVSKNSGEKGSEATPRLESKRLPLRNLQERLNSADVSSPRKKTPEASEFHPQLSEEQRAVVKAVVSRKRNVFFTGSAGTGKSLVLKTIIELLPATTTFVTASTGVAACFIGGVTLHSFAGIGHGLGTKEQCLEIAKKKATEAQWKRCERLIIDEISMVDADYFEKIEFVARKIRKSDKPFGGVQLIVTGDFLQLPPVSKDNVSIRFCFMSDAWRRCINETILLKQVKRQSDSIFVDLLQQVRLGRYSSNLITRLNATRTLGFGNSGIVPTRLCTHTADVEAVNRERLNALEGEEKVFEAKDSCYMPEAMKYNVLKRLVLKIGAQVMLIKNLDLQRRLSNGSRGVVEGFSSRGYPIVRFVATEAAEMEILPAKFSFRSPGSEASFIRLQIPLQLAWAISIHKSQGLTLDAVELSLSRVFADGQAYVALSRARSLDSIRVIDFDPTCIKANPAVVQYYERLSARSTESIASRSRVSLFHDKRRSSDF